MFFGKKDGKKSGALILFFGILAASLLKRGPEKVKTLTYRDAIRRLLSCRPANERPVRGALVKEEHQDGFRILFLFVDEKGMPLESTSGEKHPRVLIAEALDEELLECFGDGNLLIFE
jgi:hypothetical protein